MTPDPQLIIGSVQEAFARANADGKRTWRELGGIAALCAAEAIEVARQQLAWTGPQKLQFAAELATRGFLCLAPGFVGQVTTFVIKYSPVFLMILSIMQALVQSAYNVKKLEAVTTIGTGEP